MEDLNITLLEETEIFGTKALYVSKIGKEALCIFKNRGPRAAMSDYTLLSGEIFLDNIVAYVGNKESLESRSGEYLTKTAYVDSNFPDLEEVHIVSNNGISLVGDAKTYSFGARPSLPFSLISKSCLNIARATDGILEVEFGEYPQQAASKNLQKTLEDLFRNNELIKTGKKYTRNKTNSMNYNPEFQEEQQEEYVYQGKKYVRVRAHFKTNPLYTGKGRYITLSNQEKYRDEDYVWVEVQPIKWLVDEIKNKALTEKILFAGVSSIHMKWFLDTYFSKEIMLSAVKKTNSSQESNIVNNLDILTSSLEQQDKEDKCKKILKVPK